ncbi:DUF1294 domain-containing protein [Lagierella sp.]|uniref:DUF1294 domain-containing protein n=1 Tax=Lagierella sp. TaxID=2849657 RepID=UPI00262B0DF8|nr:DUF1294 domain-containing protein [Lagierella sp.]
MNFRPSFTYYIIINIVAFLAYGYDKLAAKTDQWRLSEKNLLLLALIGGFAGCMAGRAVFHHKTLKREFAIVNIISALIHIWIIGSYIIN